MTMTLCFFCSLSLSLYTLRVLFPFSFYFLSFKMKIEMSCKTCDNTHCHSAPERIKNGLYKEVYDSEINCTCMPDKTATAVELV